jgi:hypothetical protein
LLVDSSPERIVKRSSMVIVRLGSSAAARTSGKKGVIRSSTSEMKPRSMAIPTRAEMMLLDADLMFARFVARRPLK